MKLWSSYRYRECLSWMHPPLLELPGAKEMGMSLLLLLERMVLSSTMVFHR